ncbi:hypothetical protein MIS45_01300 [Wielerella bovis]|uniref:surface-adhesin E family protein n=1 Tax=Wielerella bovis TaxID=2917790 RepID=UPI0020187C62|nr:surface-adhesin E family protein [Wielerella bovis]ULJ69530.1 hypothetical protein MIS45_01300 [Wielerella bovis]
MKSTLTLIATALLLSACGSTHSPVAAKGSWTSVGKIQNGEIEVAYDTDSIVRQSQIVRLTDRKVVLDPQKTRFTQTPPYKAAITDWEFDCSKRTNRPLNTRFYDKNGTLLAQHGYTRSQVAPQAIAPNTPSFALFNIACKK